MDKIDVRLRKLRGSFGRTLILPYDQGLEHGPVDFMGAEFAGDAGYIIDLAKKGRFDAVALHVGNSERLFGKLFGEIPLILKMNGKTTIPDDSEPLSPMTASIDDALSLSAIAVGYTLYVGSSRQDEDFEQFAALRQEAHTYGLPVIVWSYPRGDAIEEKGGKNSLYAIEYAARVAAELGADMVKVNVPVLSKKAGLPEEYRQLECTEEEAVARVIRAAHGTPVIFAGGSKISDDELVTKAEICIQAGAAGLIFGRNIWQRPIDKALDMTGRIREMMRNNKRAGR